MPHSTEVPNLADFNPDCLDQEQLEHAGYFFETMARYCQAKAEAMNCRTMGHISDALHAERRAERFYSVLPANWRW